MGNDYKSDSELHDHMLKETRLVFQFSIFGDETPADKQDASDIPGVAIVRTEGRTSTADAVEAVTWTTPVDDDSGDSIFGLLIDLGENKAEKIQSVLLTQKTEGSTAPAPILGTAEDFAVLAGSTVTNTGASTVTGDLGVSPGSSVTGFPPGTITGTTHAGDATAAQAQIDLTVAYNNLVARPVTQDLTGQNLGGLTLGPGVYSFSSSAQLTGTLTLDGEGDANSTWVFQIGSTLTTASASVVDIINSGDAANVFWQVGSSATLGTTTDFKGNILAQASITLTTGATMEGRALARTGAVTLDTNDVTATSAPSAPSFTVTGPNNVANAYLTEEGNIAIEVAASGLNLSLVDTSTFLLEVEYLDA